MEPEITVTSVTLSVPEAEEPRAAAFNAIHLERIYQDRKWGESPHTVGEWIMILRKRLEEAERTWLANSCKGDDTDALAQIACIGSVAVAAMEQHGSFLPKEHLPAILG